MEQLHLRQATFEYTDARQTVAFANREASALKESRTALEKNCDWTCRSSLMASQNRKTDRYKPTSKYPRANTRSAMPESDVSV
jgi:hypothetical protein